jgi:hypothetical protein
MLDGFLERTGRMAVPVLVLACGLVTALALRIDGLENQLRDERRQASLPHVGSFLPIQSVTFSDGDQMELGSPPPGRLQLLFAYSQACEYSRLSSPRWSNLIDQIRRAGLPVDAIAVLVDDTQLPMQDGIEAWEPSAGFVSLPDDRSRYLYRTRVIPQLVVVDSSGQVVYLRTGVFESAAAQDSVFAHLANLTHPLEGGRAHRGGEHPTLDEP